jgi:hypothetical protein
MSHNKITVAGQQPDSSGNISLSSVNLADLNDVSINSPSAEQVLKFDGTNYVNSNAPAGSAEYILLGQGESSAYSNSNAGSTLTTGNYLEIYDTSPFNTITGASFTASSATNWYTSITLPAGQYFVQCQTKPSFYQSGYVLFALANTSGNSSVSAQALIGDNSTNYASGVPSTIQSHLDLSAQTTIGLRLVEVESGALNSKANQGTDISTHTFILIMKV